MTNILPEMTEALLPLVYYPSTMGALWRKEGALFRLQRWGGLVRSYSASDTGA